MSDFKLGVRELLAMILLTIGTKFTDFTPDLMFPETLMATWMVPLISAGMLAFPLWIIIKLIRKYDMGLVELMKTLSGKYIGSLFSLFIFIFSLTGTGLLLNNYAHILITLYFPQTPKNVIQIILAMICCTIACGGVYTVGRVAWVVVPYIKVALLLLLILSLSVELNFSYLFPLFGEGMDVVVKNSFFYNSIFIECILFACLIPFLKKKEVFSKAALFGLGIVALEMALFFVFYIIIFDPYSLKYLSLPFQNMTRTVQLGRFITNFESYFLAFWLLASIVKYAVYLIVTTLYFTQTFQLNNTRIYVIAVTVLVVLIGMIPENAINSSFLYRDFVLNIGSVFFIILSLILWILSLRKKESVPS